MNNEGRNSRNRANLQRHPIAQKAGRNGYPFEAEAPQILPAVPKMRSEKNRKERATDKTIFGEKVEIIVVHLHRILLEPFAPKLTSIIQVCPTARAKKWPQRLLLNCCLPH